MGYILYICLLFNVYNLTKMNSQEYAEDLKTYFIEEHIDHLISILTYLDTREPNEFGIYDFDEGDEEDYCEVVDDVRRKFKIHLYNKDITDEEIRKPSFNKPTNGIIESCLYKPLIMDKLPISRSEIAQYIDLRDFEDEIRFSFANSGYNIVSIKKDCIMFVGQSMI